MSYYQRDKLSIKSNQILSNLFADLILFSEQVQSFRQILATVPYFDCIELFRLLDKDQKGYLIQNDFINIIGEKHKKVVTYVFSWFDQTKMGQISRLQFISFLMPRKNNELQQTIARRIQQPPINSNDPTTSCTLSQQLHIFTQMLTQMIHHQLKIIQQRHLLLKQNDYSLKAVLNSFDINTHQYITANDIYKLLQNYGIQATIEQIISLLEIIDSKITGKIKQEQLKWIVEGLEKQNKEYLRRIKAANNKKINKNKFNHNNQKKITNYQNKQKQIINNQNNQQQINKSTKINKQSNHKKINQKIQKNQQKSQKKQSSQSNFQSLIHKFKQMQIQTQKRDQQLIANEYQMSAKLRQQYYNQSLAGNKAYSAVDFYKTPSQMYQNSPYKKDFIKSSYGGIKQEDKRPYRHLIEKNYYPNSIKQNTNGQFKAYQNIINKSNKNDTNKTNPNNANKTNPNNTNMNNPNNTNKKNQDNTNSIKQNTNDKYKANQDRINQIRNEYNQKNIQKYRYQLPKTQTADGNRYGNQNQNIIINTQTKNFLQDDLNVKPFVYSRNQIKGSYNDIYMSKFAQNYPLSMNITNSNNKFSQIRDVRRQTFMIDSNVRENINESKQNVIVNPVNAYSSSGLRYGQLYNTNLKQNSDKKGLNVNISSPYDSNAYNDIRSTSKFGYSTQAKHPTQI